MASAASPRRRRRQIPPRRGGGDAWGGGWGAVGVSRRAAALATRVAGCAVGIFS